MALWQTQSDELQAPKEARLWNSSSTKKTSDEKNGENHLSPGPRFVRRLSSMTASLDELSVGPSVIVPPKHLQQPSDAHETAAALELAKHRLIALGSSDGTSTPVTPQETTTTDSFAFGFDIDGVLIRGGEPIPEAVEAMKVLNGQNEYGVKV